MSGVLLLVGQLSGYAELWESNPKIIILSIYILIIPNKVPVVVIRKQGLNIKVIIKSFSL